MGACNAASYISQQPERSMIVNIRYVYARYNETMGFADQLEQWGDVFVVRPRAELYVGRIERNGDFRP